MLPLSHSAFACDLAGNGSEASVRKSKAAAWLPHSTGKAKRQHGCRTPQEKQSSCGILERR
jgi:hypothetical protein